MRSQPQDEREVIWMRFEKSAAAVIDEMKNFNSSILKDLITAIDRAAQSKSI